MTAVCSPRLLNTGKPQVTFYLRPKPFFHSCVEACRILNTYMIHGSCPDQFWYGNVINNFHKTFNLRNLRNLLLLLHNCDHSTHESHHCVILVSYLLPISVCDQIQHVQLNKVLWFLQIFIYCLGISMYTLIQIDEQGQRQQCLQVTKWT